MINCVGLARDARRQKDDEVRRVPVRELKGAFSDCGYFYAEFLSQLPPNGIRVGLARLTFSAGKLPETAVTFIQRPLANQQFAATADYSSDHADWYSHYPWPRSTLKSAKSLGGSETRSVHVMLIGRSPVMSSWLAS